jgi:hypothetical protein
MSSCYDSSRPPGSAGAGRPVPAGHPIIGPEAEPASNLSAGEKVKPRRNARQFIVLGPAPGAAIQVHPHGGCFWRREPAENVGP